MPRCQRSFRYLGSAVRGTWTCPRCPDKEVYDVVRERELWKYAWWAQAQAIADYGAPKDLDFRLLLVNGVRPECIHEPADRRYDVYLASGSDSYQQRLQIGHELFHRVAGEGQVFHWSHEMLACVFSVRLLKLAGLFDYAERVEAAYEAEAVHCPTTTFLPLVPWETANYPDGYYGRAFTTGAALEETVGYTALCRLARTLSPHTVHPDVQTWIESLNKTERNQVLLRLTV